MRIEYCGAAALAFAAFLAAGAASAEEIHFETELTAASEVPPNDSAGTGSADVMFDSESKELTWDIEFSGLTGPATAAHFHGPATETENAGPVITLEVAEGDIEGSATLTDEQASQLMEGLWYINIHTEANKGGEIRGQVKQEM
jgi:hypothetical protein